MKTKIIWLICAGIFFSCFIIPLIVNCLFVTPAIIPIFQSKWSAGDALGYIGGALTFVGTMFLGWVSWKQNQDIQKKQDDTVIAEKSCMVLLDNIEFRNLEKTATNFQIHPETIAITGVSIDTPFDYSSFECVIKLRYTKNMPVVVRVLEATLQAGNIILSFEKYDDCFTRMAVNKKSGRFTLTLVMSKDEKSRILQQIKSGMQRVSLDLKMEMASDRYISTTIKCRSALKCQNQDGDIKGVSEKEDQMCFWYGNSILERSAIKFRCDNKEE